MGKIRRKFEIEFKRQLVLGTAFTPRSAMSLRPSLKTTFLN